MEAAQLWLQTANLSHTPSLHQTDSLHVGRALHRLLLCKEGRAASAGEASPWLCPPRAGLAGAAVRVTLGIRHLPNLGGGAGLEELTIAQ